MFVASRLVDGLVATNTEEIKEDVAYVNGIRGQWSRAGGLVSTVIEQLPDYIVNKQQAQERGAAPSPITGYMSWILYYTRFGINLSLLLKHTIAGPWMSEKERKIPARHSFVQIAWRRRIRILC